MSRARYDPRESVTRRGYLIVKALEAGADFWTAQEAVSTVALAHPEWDMTDVRTFAEWEALAVKAASG